MLSNTNSSPSVFQLLVRLLALDKILRGERLYDKTVEVQSRRLVVTPDGKRATFPSLEAKGYGKRLTAEGYSDLIGACDIHLIQGTVAVLNFPLGTSESSTKDK
ncbi:hypothetical protein TNCV_51981 [Trichonephila clavipes]|nr:hypothetical protein TNCV_51981 [Trichonephila clavipes]